MKRHELPVRLILFYTTKAGTKTPAPRCRITHRLKDCLNNAFNAASKVCLASAVPLRDHCRVKDYRAKV